MPRVGRVRGGRGGMRMIVRRRRGVGVERWVRLGRVTNDHGSWGLQCMLILLSLGVSASSERAANTACVNCE